VKTIPTQYKVISTEAIPLQSETILFSKDSSSYFLWWHSCSKV